MNQAHLVKKQFTRNAILVIRKGILEVMTYGGGDRSSRTVNTVERGFFDPVQLGQHSVLAWRRNYTSYDCQVYALSFLALQLVESALHVVSLTEKEGERERGERYGGAFVHSYVLLMTVEEKETFLR
jgi:hypothetical protein